MKEYNDVLQKDICDWNLILINTFLIFFFFLFTGRQVAVDWAVPKDRYIATQSNAGNLKK